MVADSYDWTNMHVLGRTRSIFAELECCTASFEARSLWCCFAFQSPVKLQFPPSYMFIEVHRKLSTWSSAWLHTPSLAVTFDVCRRQRAGLVAPVLTEMFPCLGMFPRHLRLIKLKDGQKLHALRWRKTGNRRFSHEDHGAFRWTFSLKHP